MADAHNVLIETQVVRLRRGKCRFLSVGLSAILVSIISFFWLLGCVTVRLNEPDLGSAQRFELEEESGGIIRVSELYTIDVDGTNPTRLRVIGFAPRWSPDGTRIAFQWWEQDVATTDIRSEIRIVNADGSGLRTLVGDLISRGGPMAGGQSWSLDGKRIAFYTWRDGKRKIAVINTDGSGHKVVEQLSEPFPDFGFSPDSKKQIISTPKNEIYVARLDSGTQTLVGMGSGAVWSPDSKQIIFSQLDGEISMVKVDGSGLTKLGRKGFAPAMSPDGTKIAFVVSENRPPPGQAFQVGLGNYNIYLMNSDGSRHVRLTNSPTTEFEPLWSPDGKKIVFVVKRPVPLVP